MSRENALFFARKLSDSLDLSGTPRPDAWRTTHWDEPDVLAHARMDDRYLPNPVTDEEALTEAKRFSAKIGEDWNKVPDADKKRYVEGARQTLGQQTDRQQTGKTLLIQELQSDIHQAARKKRETEVGRIAKNKNIPRADADKQVPADWAYTSGQYGKGGNLPLIPDFPFKKTWHELLLKRLMAEAARNGYDNLAWTDGKTQADRYHMRNYGIEKLMYDPEGHTDDEGNFTPKLLGFNKDGQRVIDENLKPGETVHDYVGDAVGDALLAQPRENSNNKRFGDSNKPRQILRDSDVSGNWHTLEGQNLDVGGEGHLGFYDTMLPRIANKLFGKWGGKAEQRDRGDHKVWTIPITPALREQATKHGFPMYKRGGRIDRSHDVPYLAGEAKSGKCTYVDRRVPERMIVKRRSGGHAAMTPSKYLKIHEEHEAKSMEGTKHNDTNPATPQVPYQPAHRGALRAERHAVERDGFDWNDYQRKMAQIAEKTTEPEKVTDPPKDLYKGPYDKDPKVEKELTRQQ